MWHDHSKWRTLICEYKATQGNSSTISWGSILLGMAQWALLICQWEFLVCSQTNTVIKVDYETQLKLKWSWWLAIKLANEKGWLWNWTKWSSKASWEQDHINPCTVFLHNRFPIFTNISTQKIHIKTKRHLVRTYKCKWMVNLH